MPETIRRAALYARVSTDDQGQDPDVQLRDLRRFAEPAAGMLRSTWTWRPPPTFAGGPSGAS